MEAGSHQVEVAASKAEVEVANRSGDRKSPRRNAEVKEASKKKYTQIK
jgi:hypothetical protein